MTIFAVMAEKPNPELARKIASLFPNQFCTLTDSQWLIVDDAIPREVSEKLGVREGEYGRVMVIQTTGAGAGWHNKTVWEWLNQKTASA
ncbi:MAG: hypothetical protein JO013_16085 [Alphaproteobacteria bacterium]|nr:hypothetical protein [Alphaproteobacteria bacterium]